MVKPAASMRSVGGRFTMGAACSIVQKSFPGPACQFRCGIRLIAVSMMAASNLMLWATRTDARERMQMKG